MYISIFSDELGLELEEAIPYFKEWGLNYVDLRTKILGTELENLTREDMVKVRKILDDAGLKVGCFQSSLGKIHLPDDEGVIKDQHRKLDAIFMASDIFDCKLTRGFHFWQPMKVEPQKVGRLAELPELERVIELTTPLVERAANEGVTIAFENCGVRTHEVAAVLDKLHSSNCGMAWDPHNVWDEEITHYGSTEKYISEQIKRAKGIHVKANKAIPEAGSTLPWNRVFQELAKSEFNGPISVETHHHELKELKETWGRIEINQRLVALAVNLLEEAGGARINHG